MSPFLWSTQSRSVTRPSGRRARTLQRFETTGDTKENHFRCPGRCRRACRLKNYEKSCRSTTCAGRRGFGTAYQPDGGNAHKLPMGKRAPFGADRQVNSAADRTFGDICNLRHLSSAALQATKKAGAILHRPSSYRFQHQCQYIRGQKSKATKTTANDNFIRAHQQLPYELYRWAMWPKQVR